MNMCIMWTLMANLWTLNMCSMKRKYLHSRTKLLSTLLPTQLRQITSFKINRFMYKIEKDKTKENEWHRTIRQKKKARLEELEMQYTYVERHQPCVSEEYEKFCCGDQPHVNQSQNLHQKIHDDSIDCIKDDNSEEGSRDFLAWVRTLHDQDANLPVAQSRRENSRARGKILIGAPMTSFFSNKTKSRWTVLQSVTNTNKRGL